MYTLIQGVFYAVGMSPDADSIKFKASNPAWWETIETDHRERFERELKAADGVVTIRLEGIDALETHYTPPSVRTPSDLTKKAKGIKRPSKGNHKQPSYLGEGATNIFLSFMGCEDVTWQRWGHNTWIDTAVVNGRLVEDKFEDAIPGYIITDDVERNGRPLGFVFLGEPPAADGTRLKRTEVGAWVIDSANYHLVQQGMVYPFFYMGLPASIRLPLLEAAQAAQGKLVPNAVWSHDHTVEGVVLSSLEALYTDTVVYPYLFRRLVRQWYNKTMARYWNGIRYDVEALPDGGDLSLDLDGFFKEGDPWLFISSEQDFVHLSDILTVEHNRLQLAVYPYDIVFLS